MVTDIITFITSIYVYLVGLFFLVYTVFFIYFFIIKTPFMAFRTRCEKKTIKEAIETRRISYENKVYCVIPWPEGDKEEWAEYMMYCENNTHSSFYFSADQKTFDAYAYEWLQYLSEQEYSEEDKENNTF